MLTISEQTGNSGPFGLFSNKVSRCVQQFKVPPVRRGRRGRRKRAGLVTDLQVFTQESSEKGEVLTMAFRVLFTPNAIVSMRCGVTGAGADEAAGPYKRLGSPLRVFH